MWLHKEDYFSSTRVRLAEDAKLSLAKYPQLEEYGYLRDIAGELTFKVAFGTTGLPII